uniref:Uncharacterized protein n=1 Tax=Cucumis sativus TaxID=3659 RepID=A0A0A0LRY1_CUCSA
MINSLNPTQNIHKLIISLLIKCISISDRLHPVNHFIPLPRSCRLIQTSNQYEERFSIGMTSPFPHSMKQINCISSSPNLAQIIDQHIESFDISWNPTTIHFHQNFLSFRIKSKRILFPTKFANTIKQSIICGCP